MTKRTDRIPIAELRARAKAAGVNSFGVSREDLERQFGDVTSSPSAEPVEAAVSPPAPERSTFYEQEDPRAETRPATREPTGRRARIPLGRMTLKLQAESRLGYVRRWINDNRNRIHDALGAGYEHVEQLEDGRMMKVSRRVGTKEDGSPLTAFLMEIRQEFYDEDQRLKQEPLDAFEREINRQGRERTVVPENARLEDRGAFYVPNEGASIRRE